jgi:hypothetical protein
MISISPTKKIPLADFTKTSKIFYNKERNFNKERDKERKRKLKQH